MREFRVAAQLYLGDRERRSFSLEEVSRTILRARKLAGIDRLMIWTTGEPALYEPLVRACRRCEVEPYLWFPVLADAQGAAVGRQELLLHYDGGRGYGRLGAWQELGAGDDEFLFLCPNRDQAVERVLASFRTLLGRLDFGGVMLDRIRYPSAVNGLESLFGCFCESCRERFSETFGQPLEGRRQAAAGFISRLGGLRAGDTDRWRGFSSLYAEAGLGALATFKERSVTRVVERFAAAAGEGGLEVGLDLYTPSLASMVAQDYGSLSRCCHWLKPMIYCNAVGPAGLPLEVACLQRAFQAACPGLDAGQVRKLLRGLLPWDWPEAEESLLARGLSERTLPTELDRLPRAELAPAARLLVGLEAIRHPDFRIDITRGVLERRLEHLSGRADGLVASWNILYIPEENLRAIGAFARRARRG